MYLPEDRSFSTSVFAPLKPRPISGAMATGTYSAPVPIANENPSMSNVYPATPIADVPAATTPSAPVTDGTAGVQVTSGLVGSHDTNGLNGDVFSFLGNIGALTPSDSTSTAIPTVQPHDTGSGTWIVLGVTILAIWYLLK